MLSFSCFLNVLTLRDNLISLGKEFQKLGPDVLTPLDAKFVVFSQIYIMVTVDIFFCTNCSQVEHLPC